MSILDRDSLEASPLADLHAIASELGIDGYRRLRRAELITAILGRQEPAEGAPASEASDDSEPSPRAKADAETTPRARTARRSGSARRAEAAPPEETDAATEAAAPGAEDTTEGADADRADAERSGARRRRGRRGGRGGRAPAREADAEEGGSAAVEAAEEESEEEGAGAGPLVEGVVELLAGGSGFVRVDPPDPSDDDVYISSAQVKRCELVSGDRVTGPKRAPRRSERFASLIRIETINGRPASELADSTRFEDLPAAFPSDRIKIGSEDPTLKAIEWLTPFGKGSRVTLVGPSRSGKSEALRRLAAALTEQDDLAVSVVLAGVRPEEISEWNAGPVAPVAAVGLAASEDARSGAIEPAVDQARRLAARGADAVVLIDTLDGALLGTARKALAAARNIVDGGSVTVIATSSLPVGGETTVIALDVALAGAARFPALDIVASGVMRPELLVGEAGAEAIARTRAEASTPALED